MTTSDVKFIAWRKIPISVKYSRGQGICYSEMMLTSLINNTEQGLRMNEPLSKAYYLKEQLRQIWPQPTKDMAEKVLDDWIRQAEQSKITQLQKMAVTVKTYKKGILAWYDCHLSTGKVEGINNKIKVMKRNAYGFRDERYFTLRLYALHDCRITRNVG